MDNNKNKLILETLMGDPILSFYVNSKGVAIGTALGRVSSYVFTDQKPSSSNNPRVYDTSVENIYPSKGTSNNDKDNKDNKSSNYSTRVVKTLHESDVPSELNTSGDYNLDLESNQQNKKDEHRLDNRNDSNKHKVLELTGKYYVFASYSDEPVNSLFIYDKYLVSVVGLNTINVYNIKDYTIEKQMNISYMLNLGGANMYNKYSNYKQVVQSNDKVLMICNKFVLLVDLLKIFDKDFGDNSNSNNSNNNKDSNTNGDSDNKDDKDNNSTSNNSNNLDNKMGRLNLNFSNNRIYNRLNVSTNLLNSNVLNFEYPNIVTVHYSNVDDNEENNKTKKIISLYEIVDNNVGLVNTIEIADKKYNLVNHCKLWDTYVVVVLDYLNIRLYSNRNNNKDSSKDNTSNSNNKDNNNNTNNKDSNNNSNNDQDNRDTPTNKGIYDNNFHSTVNGYRFDVNGKFELKCSQKMKADVLSINCSLNNHMILLNKKSKIKVLNRNLVTLYTYNLFGSTFELGWNYDLLAYKDYLVYNSDEGVFIFRIPDFLD